MAAKRVTKKEIFAAFGIKYNKNKIWSPLLNAWIPCMLINGNKKIGRGVWQFSTTAGNKAVDKEIAIAAIGGEKVAAILAMDPAEIIANCSGTCCCQCAGCYACTGCYLFKSTKIALARRTFLARVDMEFTERAIMAQIIADKIKYVRIHAAGDFFNAEYVLMWARIAAANKDVIFWTYTKTSFKECAIFDALPNCNIVKSLVNGGVNYGKAGYIVRLYKDLVKQGKKVWICRCGVDPDQHCSGCHNCYESEYVLFLEHSTNYKPEEDPDFAEFCEIVNSQTAKAA